MSFSYIKYDNYRKTLPEGWWGYLVYRRTFGPLTHGTTLTAGSPMTFNIGAHGIGTIIRAVCHYMDSGTGNMVSSYNLAGMDVTRPGPNTITVIPNRTQTVAANRLMVTVWYLAEVLGVNWPQ